MGSWVVAHRSGEIASLFLQSEEDVDACSDRAGIWGIQLEVRDSLPSDGILLVFQVEDELVGVLESLDGCIKRG